MILKQLRDAINGSKLLGEFRVYVQGEPDAFELDRMPISSLENSYIYLRYADTSGVRLINGVLYAIRRLEAVTIINKGQIIPPAVLNQIETTLIAIFSDFGEINFTAFERSATAIVRRYVDSDFVKDIVERVHENSMAVMYIGMSTEDEIPSINCLLPICLDCIN